MSKKKLLTLIGSMCLILILAAMPFMTACEEEEAPPLDDGEPEVEKTEILVGAVNSLTGMNVMTGNQQKWAFEQAVFDINEEGGVYVEELGKKLPMRLVFADDKSTPAGGAEAAEKLIKLDKVDFVMGSNITPICIAAATVCEKYKVFFLNTCSWLDQWEEQNFTWAADFFFSTVSASRSPFDAWEAQKPREEHPKAIWLMMEDNPDGQGFGGGFLAHAENLGYNIALNEAYMPGTKDFSSSILKAKAANCDALFWLGFPPDSITLVRQIKENRLNLKYIHGYKGFWPTEFYEALGEDSDYIIHDGFWAMTLPYPRSEELGERFIETFGMDSVNVGQYYAGIQVLAQAIEQAGSLDGAKVRDVVFSGEFVATETTMGDLDFNEKGLHLTPCLALQWMDGQRLPVVPKVYDLEWAPPWDER